MSISAKLKILAQTVSDERFRNFVLQRQVADIGRRADRAAKLAARLPQSGGYPSAEAVTKQKTLHDDGFVMLPGLVTPTMVEDLLAYFATRKAFDPYKKQLGTFSAPDDVPAGSHIAHFDHDIVLNAPHVLSIANNPEILQIVERTLGAKPTISALMTWWSVPTRDGVPKEAENFHRDVDDWGFIKLFLYLTDVTADNGPHVFIRGSHNINELTGTRRLSEAEVEKTFGPERVQRFIGPAGTCFLENTYGVHRGFPPRTSPRLLVQVLYSLRPLPYSPERPIAKIGSNGVPAGLDPYINRLYCRPA